MYYYILPYFIYYLGLAYSHRYQSSKCAAVLLLSSLPIFLLVMLRANVGTDTLAYLEIISNIDKNIFVPLEVGFVYAVKLMILLGLEYRLILLIIAFITTVLLVRIGMFSERAKTILTFCIIPVFYLDMTMSGIRYGLSFALAALAVAYFYKRNMVLALLLGTFAILIHVSVLIVFGMMLILANDRYEFIRWFKIIIVLIVLFLLQHINVISGASFNTGLDVLSKASSYSNFKSPSLISGFAPFAISVATLIVIKLLQSKTHGDLEVSQRQFYILLLSIISTFIIAKFSYAGLRMQLCVLFCMFIAIQFKENYVGDINLKTEKRVFYIIIIIGLLGVASFLKNVYFSYGQAGSPWLPYYVNTDISHAFKSYSF